SAPVAQAQPAVPRRLPLIGNTEGCVREPNKMSWANCGFLMLVVTAIPSPREAASAAPQPSENQSRPADLSVTVHPRVIHADQDKATAASLKPHLQWGQEKVERFFGQPFKKAFEVEVFPDRAAFDEYFRKRWKLPKTAAWMVASGVADRLTILSPRVWKTQAAEHNPADAEHIRDLIAHELVHVYHGQQNPRPDFDGMDDCGWLVEGLGVYVSRQLERRTR